MNRSNSNSIYHMDIGIHFGGADACGIVYYSNYLKYAERARTKMFRSLGVTNSDLFLDQGMTLVALRCIADYRLPARLDDALSIETAINNVGGATIELIQLIIRSGVQLVSINVKLGCIFLSSCKPGRLPLLIRKCLENVNYS